MAAAAAGDFWSSDEYLLLRAQRNFIRTMGMSPLWIEWEKMNFSLKKTFTDRIESPNVGKLRATSTRFDNIVRMWIEWSDQKLELVLDAADRLNIFHKSFEVKNHWSNEISRSVEVNDRCKRQKKRVIQTILAARSKLDRLSRLYLWVWVNLLLRRSHWVRTDFQFCVLVILFY